MDESAKHKEKIIEQFSLQAVPFAKVSGHLDSMEVIASLGGISALDNVLDVACGPGILATYIAKKAAHVTGCDITVAMIETARKRQSENGQTNLVWIQGEAESLPFPDGTFSCVITRYSFHHIREPEKVMNEMIRVCKPGGRILVADVSMPDNKAEAYDRLELIRDPSHVHALTEKEFCRLFARKDIKGVRRSSYGVDIELETQIAASFPAPGGQAIIRRMITEDIGIDAIGINSRRQSDGEIVYTCPISVFTAVRI